MDVNDLLDADFPAYYPEVTPQYAMCDVKGPVWAELHMDISGPVSTRTAQFDREMREQIRNQFRHGTLHYKLNLQGL